MVSMPADAAPGRLWTAEAIHSRPVVMRRATVLSALARRLVALQPRRRLQVAIDGVDGAGKSVLADELATRLMAAGRPAVRASVDSFHRPQADRYRLGRTSPEGFYRDSYDYQRLTEFVLVPFAPGGSGRFRVAGFDHKTDTPVSPPKQHAARRAVLILDGIFLHRPELRASWDFSIFLHVGFDVSIARCAQRDGSDPDPDAASNRRYVAGQRLYLLEARPWEHASVIIDNTNLTAPAIIAPDVVRRTAIRRRTPRVSRRAEPPGCQR
jgi:uridine kinase